MADGVIGGASIAITPDAEDFVRRFLAQTQPGMVRAGKTEGEDFRRALQGELDRGANIKVKADSSQARSELSKLKSDSSKSFGSIRKDVATLAPALVPLGAVAGAVGAEFGALGVAGVLAVKGISAEFKSGALAGTPFAADITGLSGELTKLEGIASGGLLSGLDSGFAATKPEFAALNTEVSGLAGQLGKIVGGAAPGLVAILTDLSPLLNEITGDLAGGAAGFDRWTHSSGGVSKFVAYAQAQLPAVEHDVEALAKFTAHLVEGLEPLGPVALKAIGLLADTLDKIHPNVLTDLASAAIATYGAFRSYSLINGLVTGVTTKLDAFAASSASSALVQKASALSVESSAAQEAAAVAAAKAAEMRAAAEAAFAIATSDSEIGSEQAGLSAIIAENAIDQAASFQSVADAAATSAAEIAAAAAAAARSVDTAGALASGGFAAALGPIGAVVVGVGLLATTFLHSSHNNEEATTAVNNYTSALVQSKGAIDANVRAQAAKALGDSGALAAAQKLGISGSQVTSAVLGNAGALAKVRAQLTPATAAYDAYVKTLERELSTGARGVTQQTIQANAYGKLTAAQKAALGPAQLLSKELGLQGTAFGKSTAAARLQLQAEKLAGTTAGTTAISVAHLTTELQNLAQTQLAQAQSEDAFKEGLLGITSSVKDNGDSLSDNTAKGLANRDMLLQLLGQTVSLANAQQKNGVAIGTVTDRLAGNVSQLEATAIHAGLSKSAVHQLVQQMGLTPRDIETKFRADTTPFFAALASVNRALSTLDHQVAGPTIVNSPGGRSGSRTGAHASAAGSASWAPNGKLPPGYSTVGERGWELVKTDPSGRSEVFSHPQSMAMTGMPSVLPGFASGTDSKSVDYRVDGESYSTLKAAVHAAELAFSAQLNLGVHIDNGDLASLQKSLTGTAAQARAEFQSVFADLHKLGIDPATANALKAQNKTLDEEIAKLNSATSKLNNLRQETSQLKSSVLTAVTGSFDITTAGTGYDGSQTVSGGSLEAQAKQAANLARKFDRDVKALSARHVLSKGEIAQLASAGPSALPQVDALLGLSKSGLESVASSEATIRSSGADLGGTIANQDYGSAIRNYAKDVRSDTREVHADFKALSKDIREFVNTAKNQPIVIKVNDRVIAKVVRTGNNKNLRRK